MCHLITLSVSRLHGVHDEMFNEFGSVGGMETGKRNQSTRKELGSLLYCPPQLFP
jgi:hypothetical protein